MQYIRSHNCLSKLLKHLYTYSNTILPWAWSHKVKVSALIPHPPQAPVDTMIKMALQIPPQTKPAGIESAHALDQNTSYAIFGSGNFWSRKPDSVSSYFLYKKKHNLFI